MGRGNTDDNEAFRRAGHCNRSTMRLLGSSGLPAPHRVSLPPPTRRAEKETSGEREGAGGRAGRARELAIVISHARCSWVLDRVARERDEAPALLERTSETYRAVKREKVEIERGRDGREEEEEDERKEGERERERETLWLWLCGHTPRSQPTSSPPTDDPPDPTMGRST